MTATTPDELRGRAIKAFNDTARAAPFVRSVADRLQIVELERTAQGDSRAVCTITVEQDMVNGAMNLHGACSAYLIELCTKLAIALHAPGTANTQGLNVVYHAPAVLGAPLRVICTTRGRADGSTVSGSAEIWDTENKRLVASGLLVRGAAKL